MGKYKTPYAVRAYQREKAKNRTLRMKERGVKVGRIICRIEFEDELRRLAKEDIEAHGLTGAVEETGSRVYNRE